MGTPKNNDFKVRRKTNLKKNKTGKCSTSIRMVNYVRMGSQYLYFKTRETSTI